MLTEQTAVVRIVILEMGHMLVTKQTRIVRDGAVVAAGDETTHEYAPGEDVSHEHPSVVRQAEAAWTPEVVATWRAFLVWGQQMAAEAEAQRAAADLT